MAAWSDYPEAGHGRSAGPGHPSRSALVVHQESRTALDHLARPAIAMGETIRMGTGVTRLGRLVGALDRLSTASGILVLFVAINVVSLAVSLGQTAWHVLTTERQTVNTTVTMAARAADEFDERLRHVVALARAVERLPAFWDGSDADRDRLLQALAMPDQRVNALVFATLDLEQHGASNHGGSNRPNLAERV